MDDLPPDLADSQRLPESTRVGVARALDRLLAQHRPQPEQVGRLAQLLAPGGPAEAQP